MFDDTGGARVKRAVEKQLKEIERLEAEYKLLCKKVEAAEEAYMAVEEERLNLRESIDYMKELMK